jgi:hypothetical protein
MKKISKKYAKGAVPKAPTKFDVHSKIRQLGTMEHNRRYGKSSVMRTRKRG